MATIYDVAKAAGTSTKTVSRVLNGDGPVSATTRSAVEGAIAALDYVPSSAARAMRSRRSGLIGLITGAISADDVRSPAGLPEIDIVRGIQKIVQAAGKTLLIADTGGDRTQVSHLFGTFLEHRVEGLIHVASHHREVTLPVAAPAPPVVLANCFDAAGTPTVVPGDRAGQRHLVARLIETGHERIGYLTLGPRYHATALRTAGYRDALEAAGIPHDDALVRAAYDDERPTDTTLLQGAIDALTALTHPPTVLCCGNDKMAMTVYGVLRSRGLTVPRDMSVAGYDDYRLIAEQLFPPLTTVELPYERIGELAAERLLGLVAAGDRAPSTALPVQQTVEGPVRWRSSVLARRIRHTHPRPRRNAS